MADCDLGGQRPPLLSLDEALSRIRSRLRPVTGEECVMIERAKGRILARDIVSPIDSPPFANAAMDGYALRSADSPTELGSVMLHVIGTSLAGKPYRGEVANNQCVRIFTGAAVPGDCDAIVIQEEVERAGDFIRLGRPVLPQEYIRSAGRDMLAGQRVLKKGKRLTAIDMGLIAAVGKPEVRVFPRPRIALISTGDELRSPGRPLEYGEIYDSNRIALKDFLHGLNVEVNDLGTLPDDPGMLESALADAAGWNDAIITIGGASVGDADHLVSVLKTLGRMDFWKVAVKPGKPFAFGQIGSSYVFGLPGNPVSAIVIFLEIVRPALLQLMGGESESVLRLSARATRRIDKAAGRMEFQRAVYTAELDGTLTVTPLPGQEADRLAPLGAANCFLLLPADSRAVEAGEPVMIEPFVNFL